MQQQRASSRGLRLPRQRRKQLPLRLRPDPGHLAEPSLAGGVAQLLEGAHAEHPADLEHPLDRDAEEAAEPGQLRRDLALELPQFRDLAGLDELTQPPVDAGPDAAQLSRPPLADELGDRRGRPSDQLGGTPVRARGVRPRARKLEQGGERVKPARDLGVVRRRPVHCGIVSRRHAYRGCSLPRGER